MIIELKWKDIQRNYGFFYLRVDTMCQFTLKQIFKKDPA